MKEKNISCIAEEVHAKETIKAKKAMAKEWLQLKYPHRQWVYNVNSHKTASFMLLKPKTTSCLP